PSCAALSSRHDLSRLHMALASGDVIVTTQKTIDLVFHTQVFKRQRARETLSRSCAGPRSLRHNGMAEGHHETPDHSLPIYGHGSIAGRALTQGAQDYSGTSGGEPCKSLCMPESPPLISNRR